MKLRLLALALAILAVLAVPAAAADHDFTLSAAKTLHEWEGAPDVTRGSPLNDPATREQLGCATPARPCEEVLLKVEEAGKFTATVEGLPAAAGGLVTDVDAWLYKADASGAAEGPAVATSTASGPDTVSMSKAVPGFYLLVVDYYNAYGSGYKGILKFTPAAPPAAPAAPAAAPTPAAPAAPAAPAKKPAAKKKPSCASKAKKIKNRKKRAAALKKCKKAAKKKK